MRPSPVIPLLLAASLHAQTSGAAGIVVDQTGKPIPGVHVRMFTGGFDQDDGVQAVYGATSDSTGRFSMDGMKAGLYMVMAERAGFVQVAAAATPMGFAMLPLKPGQHLTDYKVVLTPRAVIAGKVVDEYGDPVQGVNVEIEPVAPSQVFNVFGRSSAGTDDRGEFRLTAPPGKYYLKASEFNRQGDDVEVRTDGTNGAPFTTTYYPSAANTGAASVVQVAAGQDAAGMEIRLLRTAASAAAHGLTVSGIVTGMPEDGGVTVTLTSGNSPEEMHESNGRGIGPDGKFSFGNQEPGYYRVVASYSLGKTPLESRPIEFRLDASDQTGLQLALGPGEELSGTLEVLGDAPAGTPEKHTVRLEDGSAWGMAPDGPAVDVGPDGSFHMTNVMPRKFKPIVEPMPENGYVKSVALDGKEVAGRVIDLSQGAGGSRLKIIIGRDGGQISGRVLDKDGEPSQGLLMVFFGTDAKHMEDGAARVTGGKYSFKALRPGKYRLIALDMAELMQAFSGDGENDEMMQRFFDTAEEVEIKAGDRISKDIPAVTKLPEKKEAR